MTNITNTINNIMLALLYAVFSPPMKRLPGPFEFLDKKSKPVFLLDESKP